MVHVYFFQIGTVSGLGGTEALPLNMGLSYMGNTPSLGDRYIAAPSARISVDAEHMVDPHTKLAVIGRLYKELDRVLVSAGVDTLMVPPSDYDTHTHCPRGTDRLYRCKLTYNPKGPVELLRGPRDGDLTAAPEEMDTLRVGCAAYDDPEFDAPGALDGAVGMIEEPVFVYQRWGINKETRRWVFVYVN